MRSPVYERAAHALQTAEKTVGKTRMHAMLAGSNLDVLVPWHPERMQAWVDEYASDTLRLPDRLDAMRDVADALLYLAAHGEGGERVVTSERLARQIQGEADGAVRMVGSTAAQAACAAAAVGASVLLCPTALSPALCRALPPHDLYFLDGGVPVLAAQVRLRAGEEVYAPHFVFQFARGATVRHHGASYTAPHANRLIATYDPLNETMPLREAYLAYIAQEAPSLASLLVAGFHTVRDASVLRQRAAYVAQWLADIRRRAQLPVTLELASYAAPYGFSIVLESLRGQVDLVSCNEDELASWCREADLRAPQGVAGAVEALEHLHAYAAPRYGVIFHTRDMALYYGHPCPFDMGRALAMGNLLSGAKARFMSYGTKEQVRLVADEAESAAAGAWRKIAEAVARETRTCIVVAAKTLDNPPCTIGLGDSFIAGVQLSLGLP